MMRCHFRQYVAAPSVIEMAQWLTCRTKGIARDVYEPQYVKKSKMLQLQSKCDDPLERGAFSQKWRKKALKVGAAKVFLAKA